MRTLVPIDQEISDDIDKAGYEIVRIGRANAGDTVFNLNGAITRCMSPIVANERIIVRKKATYRPAVAPQDLGKECQFSDDPNFGSVRTCILDSILLPSGRVVYETNGFRYFHCRIKETS